jgi:hypothetical protein
MNVPSGLAVNYGEHAHNSEPAHTAWPQCCRYFTHPGTVPYRTVPYRALAPNCAQVWDVIQLHQPVLPDDRFETCPAPHSSGPISTTSLIMYHHEPRTNPSLHCMALRPLDLVLQHAALFTCRLPGVVVTGRAMQTSLAAP